MTIDDIVNQTVNRLLDQLAIKLPSDLFARWPGGRAQAREGEAPQPWSESADA